jgi:hypothetical protein
LTQLRDRVRSERIFPEAHQVGVEELAAIVGVQFQHGEGQALQDALKSVFHDPVAAAQHGPRSLRAVVTSVRWAV